MALLDDIGSRIASYQAQLSQAQASVADLQARIIQLQQLQTWVTNNPQLETRLAACGAHISLP